MKLHFENSGSYIIILGCDVHKYANMVFELILDISRAPYDQANTDLMVLTSRHQPTVLVCSDCRLGSSLRNSKTHFLITSLV